MLYVLKVSAFELLIVTMVSNVQPSDKLKILEKNTIFKLLCKKMSEFYENKINFQVLIYVNENKNKL